MKKQNFILNGYLFLDKFLIFLVTKKHYQIIGTCAMNILYTFYIFFPPC